MDFYSFIVVAAQFSLLVLILSAQRALYRWSRTYDKMLGETLDLQRASADAKLLDVSASYAVALGQYSLIRTMVFCTMMVIGGIGVLLHLVLGLLLAYLVP